MFEPASDRDVRTGTVTRAKATCLCCGVVLPPERVRAQLAAQRGGADAAFDDADRRVGGARLTAVVTLRPGETGRHYRLPSDADYAAVRAAQARLAGMLDDWERGGKRGLCPVPDEPISLNEIRRISLPIYGMKTWGDCFTVRQKLALLVLGKLVTKQQDNIRNLCGLAISRLSEMACSICTWEPIAECPRHVFGRQAIQVTWDFSEGIPTSTSSGSFKVSVDNIAAGINSTRTVAESFLLESADATAHPLPDQAANIWFTDPPYYDAVPYAHLSDFFFVWLKRALPDWMMNFGNLANPHDLTPKEKEIVVDRPHRLSTSTKTAATYESGMAAAFAEGHRVLHPDGIGSVVFAHKTTEGWEALLSGMISGGWTITGSWPVATEMGSRLNARETASLATSVHLICRPRPADAPVGDQADVLRELPPRVGEWMERLQGEGVRGADLVFACIGPALEIFSRWPSVETAEGREVGLAEYLEKGWEVVGRTALENILGAAEARARNGLAGALEEDARLTALFLWTLQTTDADAPEAGGAASGDASSEPAAADETPRGDGAGYVLVYDVVRRFAQPLGIRLPDQEGRIVETAKGVVRLLPVGARETQLFGRDGVGAAAASMERDPSGDVQLLLFPAAGPAGRPTPPRPGAGRRGQLVADDDAADAAAVRARDTTTLDRVHAAMLLQASGQSQALRKLLRAEQDRGPDRSARARRSFSAGTASAPRPRRWSAIRRATSSCCCSPPPDPPGGPRRRGPEPGAAGSSLPTTTPPTPRRFAPATRPRSTASTRRCCSRRRARARRSASCCGPSRTAAPTSSGWRTRCRPSTRPAAPRSACWTPCCWRSRGRVA